MDPQFVDVQMNINGRRSSFSVPGIIDVKLENFINPVTGEEQDTKIQLPKGFIWKLADYQNQIEDYAHICTIVEF